MTIGLREIGKTVATTGEGINDVEALSKADVGFAMGSGVAVAKDKAAMVLSTDNFESTMFAVMWGRNIYANVRKFIQFQVTCNITALVVTFIGVLVGSEPPITVVQLLWLNLVMDTFAAIALGSERPHASIVKTPPVKENEPLLTPIMWRQIYGISAYIILIMIVFYFFVDNMWGLDYTTASELDKYRRFDDSNNSTVLCHHYTLLFNTFMWMHIFNEINCRKVGATEYNVFHNI
jgi:Ca2+ transporting ATPase